MLIFNYLLILLESKVKNKAKSRIIEAFDTAHQFFFCEKKAQLFPCLQPIQCQVG